MKAPLPLRVSSTRQGATGNSDSPSVLAGRQVAVDINHQVRVVAGKRLDLAPVPAGTMAALATTVPVKSFKVETAAASAL